MTNYASFLEECSYTLSKKKASRDADITLLKDLKKRRNELKLKIKAIDRGREVVQETAEDTQKELEYKIGGLVTLALQAVFDKRYSCEIKFVSKRGKREANIVLYKDDLEIDNVMESSGGGVGDVMSFALRLSIWSLRKTRALFLLDEPFIRVKGYGKQEKCFQLLHELSKEGIQFIIVSHEDKMIYMCDKEIHITEGIDTKSGGEKYAE